MVERKRGLTRSESIIRQGRASRTKIDLDEEVLPGLTQKSRLKILESIQSFGDFPLEDPRSAIAYIYSIIARIEEEYTKLEQIYEEEGDTVKGIKNRINILNTLSTNVNKLVKSMVDHQNIKESRQRQELMTIQEHSAILEAIMSAFTISLLQEGLSEDVRISIFKRFKDIQGQYPVVTTDLERIKKRLYGTPEELIDVEVEAILVTQDEDPELVYEAALKMLSDDREQNGKKSDK